MIASQKEEVFRILDLVRKHETNDFEILLAAIDVITQKQIVRLWWKVADFKYSQQVNIFSVNISSDYKRRIEFN